MYTFEEIGSMLDVIVGELPADVVRGLNGGVYLLPEVKRSKQIPSAEYFVMGEYRRDQILGRSICLYYGSFLALHIDASVEEMRAALKHTVLHEFRHHMEGLAGDRSLEVEDHEFVQAAFAKLRSKKK